MGRPAWGFPAEQDSGGGAAGLGGGERVGEHQRMSRKLFAGFVGREEGWRIELHGRPASGGANGGRR